MRYELTQHAKDVLAERGIRLEWLETALAKPQLTVADAVDPDLEHRLLRIPDYGNRVLRVILNCTVDPVRVVSVYFDRGMRNKL